jgi:uncharacterized protein YggE
MNEQAHVAGTERNGTPTSPVSSIAGRRFPWRVRGAALAAASLVVAFALVGCGGSSGGAVTAGATTTAPTINAVTATGQVTVLAAPDQAVLMVSVQNDAADPATAMDQNAKTMKAVIDRLKAEGLADSAIETTGVQVYPLESTVPVPMTPTTGAVTPPVTSRVTGYRATNSVQVTITHLDTVGKIYAAAIEAGANNVSGPTWRLSDDSAAIKDALKRAVGTAKGKADAMASAAGASVGAVVSLNDNASSVPLVNYFGATAAGAKSDSVSAPPVQQQQLEITASVTAVYELKP